MIDLKQYWLDTSSGLNKILISTLPNAYVASSMHDFIENRFCLIPTNSLLYPGLMYTGKSFMFFANTFYFEKTGDKKGILYDVGGEFEIGISPYLSKNRKEYLSRGLSIDDPKTIYSHKHDQLELFSFEKNTFLEPESESEFSLDVGLKPALNTRF